MHSRRVHEVKALLVARLQTGLLRPGTAFASARQLSRHHGVSYQTAHRLLRELVDEGWLDRRDRSGTFVRGRHRALRGVWLAMHERARTPNSFGRKLRSELEAALSRAGLSYDVDLSDTTRIPADRLPVLWERPALAERCATEHRAAIVINDRPTPGRLTQYLDSVSADDFAGGALAAEVLLQAAGAAGPFVILAGPSQDRRSAERVAGFRSHAAAEEVAADNWYRDAGRRTAAAVLAHHPAAVFACNDRLAQGLLITLRRGSGSRSGPLVMGYDDAPIAEPLGLSTIALPWRALAQAVAQRATARLGGDDGPACHIVLHPHPVIRTSTLRSTR